MADPWEVLGLAPGTAFAEVRARWLELTRRLHPDHHHDAAAASRLAVVNSAYVALKAERGREGPPVAEATFPDAVFEALLQAAADIGDVTDAAEPCSVDLRVDGGWCHAELVGDLLTVDTLNVDPDRVCDQLTAAMGRYIGARRGGR
jgi:hypothetical protein